MLSLRILTLTDEEKREMAARTSAPGTCSSAPRPAAAEELMRLHGVLRPVRVLERGAVNEQDWRLLDADRRSRSSGSTAGSSRRATASASGPAAGATSSTWCSTARSRAGRVHRAGPRGQLPGLRRAGGGSRRLSRPAAAAGPPLLLLARGGGAAAAAMPAPAARGTPHHPRRRDRQHLPGRRRLRRRGGPAACGPRPLPDGVTVVDYGIRGYDLAYALVGAPTTRSWWMPAPRRARRARCSCSSPTRPTWTRPRPGRRCSTPTT